MEDIGIYWYWLAFVDTAEHKLAISHVALGRVVRDPNALGWDDTLLAEVVGDSS